MTTFPNAPASPTWSHTVRETAGPGVILVLEYPGWNTAEDKARSLLADLKAELAAGGVGTLALPPGFEFRVVGAGEGSEGTE